MTNIPDSKATSFWPQVTVVTPGERVEVDEWEWEEELSLTADCWLVRVTLKSGGLQEYRCTSERQARQLAALWGRPGS